MTLADKIIDLRRKSGWSQEELAHRLNVSRQPGSKWESAQSVPEAEKAAANEPVLPCQHRLPAEGRAGAPGKDRRPHPSSAVHPLRRSTIRSPSSAASEPGAGGGISGPAAAVRSPDRSGRLSLHPLPYPAALADRDKSGHPLHHHGGGPPPEPDCAPCW